MLKWLKYNKGAIFRDKSKGGLLSQFLKDYKTQFGGSINPSCPKCLSSYYDNFYKHYTMKEVKENHGFVLKLKYNTIKSPITKRPCRNADLTKAQAIELLEFHPHGEKLFDKIPKSYYDSKKPKKEVVKKEVVKNKK